MLVFDALLPDASRHLQDVDERPFGPSNLSFFKLGVVTRIVSSLVRPRTGMPSSATEFGAGGSDL
jgi:hypothetical protein